MTICIEARVKWKWETQATMLSFDKEDEYDSEEDVDLVDNSTRCNNCWTFILIVWTLILSSVSWLLVKSVLNTYERNDTVTRVINENDHNFTNNYIHIGMFLFLSNT